MRLAALCFLSAMAIVSVKSAPVPFFPCPENHPLCRFDEPYHRITPHHNTPCDEDNPHCPEPREVKAIVGRAASPSGNAPLHRREGWESGEGEGVPGGTHFSYEFICESVMGKDNPACQRYSEAPSSSKTKKKHRPRSLLDTALLDRSVESVGSIVRRRINALLG